MASIRLKTFILCLVKLWCSPQLWPATMILKKSWFQKERKEKKAVSDTSQFFPSFVFRILEKKTLALKQ